MIPYKDDNPTDTIPFVTVGIILLNIAVYIWGVLSPSGQQQIAYSYGAIPQQLFSLDTKQPIHPFATALSSMFLHGGLFHLGGNMLYLWIFGNNIEDRLGHLKFLLFYIAAGIIAAYAHALTEPSSLVPMIGASGAVSGILGAYLFLFPRASVYTLMFFGFFIQTLRVPAFMVIGFWAAVQVLNGLIYKGLLHQGGVAWFAHIGGFLFGLITIKLWLSRKKPGH